MRPTEDVLAVLLEVLGPVGHVALVDLAKSGGVAVLDLFLHVKFGWKKSFQNFSFLVCEIEIAAWVKLTEQHVHDGPIGVNTKFLKERTANLKSKKIEK